MAWSWSLICLDLDCTPPCTTSCHLAIIDISCNLPAICPLLANLMETQKSISFVLCTLQMIFNLIFFFYGVFDFGGDVLWQVCGVLPPYSTWSSWTYGGCARSWPLLVMRMCLAIVQVSLFLRLPFCGPQKVNHFFCEIQSVLKVTCGDIWDQWNASLCWRCVCFSWAPFLDVGLLCAHPLGNPEDPVKGGPESQLTPPAPPPLCGWVLLWHDHDGVTGPDSSHPKRNRRKSFSCFTVFSTHYWTLLSTVCRCSSELPSTEYCEKRTVWGGSSFGWCFPSEMWLLV